MKIGLFTDAYKPQISGVTTSLNMLAEGLIKEGHEVYIITVKTKGSKEFDIDKPYILRFRGIPYPRKGLEIYRFVPCVGRHVRRIKKKFPKFDVIHVHTEFSIGKLAYLYQKRTKTPMVYTSHTMYEEYLHYVGKRLAKMFRRPFMWIVKKMLKRYVKSSQVSIVPSKKILDLMNKYNIEGNYKIVPTGIDLEKFKKETYKEKDILKLKESLGLKDEFVCLFIGRVSSEKSIDVLLKGFKELNNENMKFLIVGDGPYMGELKNLIKKLDLEDKVILTGMVNWEDVGLYYQLGDCFLNASISETQGLTYIEALAAGLPLLVKHDQVLEAVVTDGYNGLFFHEDDELQSLIERLKEDKKLKEELSKNALLSVKKYSQEEYAKNALETYEEAIKLYKEKQTNK
ncbi:MAG: glycosyltransferase family 4 protein [Acholeplasmataceae bacterium]|jgi:1,2-diacylglycerol 3-alpha-glucosyltransferase|nr:glycosyltransferase family 4 protein [Acholeplasmataceae bacterium]